MTIHPIDRLVRQANPVPDHTALEPAELSDLLELEQWRETVDTQLDQDTQEEQRKPSRLLIGAAAAVVAVALVGAVAFAVSSDDQPVAWSEEARPILDYPGEGGGDLAGARYSVFAYTSDGEVINKLQGTTIILQFGYDGTISGTGGCNDYQAGYEVTGDYAAPPEGLNNVGAVDEGQLIQFSGFTATDTVCASPELMAQEAMYFARLAETGRWFIDRDRELFLATADHTLLVGARPRPEE